MTDKTLTKRKVSKATTRTLETKIKSVSRNSSEKFLATFKSAKSIQEKLSVAKTWTETNVDDSSAWFFLGELYRETGDTSAAILAFTSAYLIEKTSPSINGRLGDLLFLEGRYSESLDHFSCILESSAPPSWAYIGAANAAERLNDSKSALVWLLKAKIEIGDTDSDLNRRIVENFWRLTNNDMVVHVEDVKGCLKTIISGFKPLLIRILQSEYADLNPDVAISNLTSLEHFALYGIPKQLRVSRLFDNAYLSMLAEQQGIDLSTQHCSCIFFSADNTDLLPASWLNINYIRRRNFAFRRAAPLELLEAILDGAIEYITPLFNSKFYLEHAKQIGLTVNDPPLMHYLRSGWIHGADPHPLFDGSYYISDLREGFRLEPNNSPLTEFILSRNDSAFSPSPFIDLKYLRHFFSLAGYQYENDAHLLASALEMEWVNIQPHVHRSMLSLLLTENEIDALHNPEDATLEQFSAIVAQLRLGKILKRNCLTSPPLDYVVQAPEPIVSVIILNFNKPIYTLLSVYSACRASQSVPLEILVVDNASQPFFTELLFRYTQHLPNVRILPIKENRFFGEGNNLAIDQSRGEFVLLLNNDAFLGTNTLDKLLLGAKTNSSIGAIAPVLFLTDGRIQEVGGTIFGDGTVVQMDKLLSLDEFTRIYSENLTLKDVDYASAACILISKTSLEKVFGFDVTFDPFYYEDTDLCARIRAQGLKIKVKLDAFAMHVENASTREFIGDNWVDLIGRQRQKFANRWHGVYERLSEPTFCQQSERFAVARKYEILTSVEVKPGYSGKTIAWVYTPFDVRVGGGERYILSVASALAEQHEVWFLTNQRMSRARLALTLDDLGINPGRFHHAILDDTADWQRPDVYVVMGNEIEPPTPAFGMRNFYHIQFPFPIHHTGHFSIERIHKFDAFIVNSKFTSNNVRKALTTYKIGTKPIHIIFPPVSIPSQEEQSAIIEKKHKNTSPIKIVNIGRFVTQGHHKRQDVVMDIAEECHRQKLPVRFEIYGGLGGGEENTKYFANLAERGARIKAKVRANVSRKVIESALNEALFYIHPCGIGHYPGLSPEKLEHFGIAVVEAMSRKCIPIVYGWGGPSELLSENKCGFHISDIRSTVNLIASISNEFIHKELNKISNCRNYSDEDFKNKLLDIIRK
jgi:GT2 family glycosyltransferase/glycosyltransferase involved in cell wall biosynthesis/tetratricopeptide (TPR) repeat protein